MRFLLPAMALVLASLALGGCCKKTLPGSSYKDTTIYRVTYRDTIIGISLPGAQASGMVSVDIPTTLPPDTIYRSLVPMWDHIRPQVIRLQGLQKSDTSCLSTPLAWSKAWVSGARLYHILKQPDTTITRRLEGAIKEIETLKKQVTIEKFPVHFLTWWDKLWVWSGRILWGFVILWIAWKVVKNWIPIIGVIKKIL